MSKILPLLALSAALIIGFAILLSKTLMPTLAPIERPTSELHYKGTENFLSEISLFSEAVSQISDIEITPDGRHMLIATLPGKVIVFQKVDGVFRRQIEPFYELQTSQPGFPPEEAGLSGMALGAKFGDGSDTIFLSYSFKAGEKEFKNRVERVNFTKIGERIKGMNAKLVFDANTPGAPSHQIQDGVGVMVADKPHFMFTVGEGFKAERALNPAEEAGKLILIQEDGSPAIGNRPFPESPKVQALGIRNAAAIAKNPMDETKIMIGDTGPDNFDRLIYGSLFESNGQNDKKLSFGWNGTEVSLSRQYSSLYDKAGTGLITYRWSPTMTPVDISFYENSALPKLRDEQNYILVSLFGRTGTTESKPGKKIDLGILTKTNSGYRVDFKTLIERSGSGEGKLGHPLGLAVDPSNGDIYFGDIMEGRIYKVTLKGGDMK